MAIDEQAYSFMADEAKDIRSFHEDSIKEIGKLEKYALLATVTIWSWAISQSEIFVVDPDISRPEIAGPGFLFLMLLPLAVQILFGIRACGIYQDMKAMKTYLLAIEDRVGLDSLGWASYWDKRVSTARLITHFGVWPLMHMLTIGVFIFATRF